MQYLNRASGWLCLDKPSGISSNFAMVKVRRIFQERTGYIGTLDPFATGVLPIAVGEARKFIPYANETVKKYIFTMAFGKTTDTLDISGQITEETNNIPSIEQVNCVLRKFIGPYMQVPPVFSAIKINGVRACDKARRGNSVQLDARPVHIFDIKLLQNDLPAITLEVSCSKGTYVRSLARDIAEKLESLACVTALRRIQAGFFSIKHAISLEKLLEIRDTTELVGVLYPLESPLDDIPALYVGEENAIKLQRGIAVSGQCGRSGSNVKIFDDKERKFRGIGCLSDSGVVSAVRMCIDDVNKGVKDVDNK